MIERLKSAYAWVKARFWPFASGGAAGFVVTKFNLLSLLLAQF
jgi:hypothetical protein